MKVNDIVLAVSCCVAPVAALAATNETAVADLGTVLVEGSALARYRPETVAGGTWTDEAPENLPCAVDTLTEDFIRERNPTDMNDLLRWVPGIETGGTSLLVRQPGLFSIRGLGGTEPAFDGVIPVGRGAGLFLDPSLMERVEVVKGPIASLAGGAGAQQNNNGAGGAINLHLKGARLDGSARNFQETTSVGRNTWRQRATLDANEVVADEKAALRVVGSFDLHSPVYTNKGGQDGARPREQYSLAPSFVVRASDDVTIGVKSLFVASDAPSYIGVPVWRGRPAAGYGWTESSARKSDRSTYKGLLVHPYVDWQVTDAWRLKFGGAFSYSHLEQSTREPYTESGAGLTHYFETGRWLKDEKYQLTDFSESRTFGQGYNLYVRSVLTHDELPGGLRNAFVAQPDFAYRESSGTFGTPTARYGVTVQDSLGWGWVTLLGGLRYDYFVENSSEQTTSGRTGRRTVTPVAGARAFAFSPRGGLTVKPLDWLVFFGNLSQTRTPTLGYRDADGSRPTDPWVATQLEGGVRVRPLDRLWLSASYFHIDQENTPVAETTGAETYYRFEGHNRAQGVEVGLEGDVTEDWTVRALYAYTTYEDCTATGKAADFERFPRHAVTVSTSYRLNGWAPLDDVVIGGSYRFRSKSYATMRGSYVDENLYFDPSHVFDITVTVPLRKFSGPDSWYLTAGVRNLFGEEYFETSRHYYECFAGEPRTFEIGLRGSF